MGELYRLKDLSIKNTYSSLEVDLVKGIVNPLLERSIQYWRGVGFFTSGWLKEAAKGLLAFVKNDGKARIITSPYLSPEDWEIIKKADKDRHEQLIIKTAIEKTISSLEEKLEWDTLAALAWLIEDGILEIRFAVPKENLSGGIFHSKLSIFIDSYGDGVALHGSQNDSLQASLNEESFSAFCSWNDGAKWFAEHYNRYNNTWINQYSNLTILKISEAEKEIITRYTNKLPRPYSLNKQTSVSKSNKPKEPTMKPSIYLRDYQEEAIQQWYAQDKRGIFEMATGTGKTITAISAAIKIYQECKSIALIVLVPYKHLVEQWASELIEFGFSPINCYESVNIWKPKAAEKIREYNSNLINNLCLVATHQTAATESFMKIQNRINKSFLLIGDEIHELGSGHNRMALNEKTAFRIGLSATPDRWYDEEGTRCLRNYFGATVIKYELDKAISERALTPYQYYPEKIDLEVDEIEEYINLTKIIARLRSSTDDNNVQIERLLRKRSDLVGNAKNKLPKLLELVEQHRSEYEIDGKKFQHVLFYCNKGKHKEVLTALNNIGLRVHEFVYDVTLKRRREVLDAFSKGDIDGLVAIKCLDQGVDVPATKRAYILASSTNPREFVQRRGRILRKSSDKTIAIVHDFLVGPWNTSALLGEEVAKNMLLRELPRFAEFSLDSINSQEARDCIWETILKLDLVPYMRKRPWDVYFEVIKNGY